MLKLLAVALIGALTTFANAQSTPKQLEASCQRWGNAKGTKAFDICMESLSKPKPSLMPRNLRDNEQSCLSWGHKHGSHGFSQCVALLAGTPVTLTPSPQPAATDGRSAPSSAPEIAKARSECEAFGYGPGSDAFARCVHGNVEKIRAQQNSAKAQHGSDERAWQACRSEFMNAQGQMTPDRERECRANPSAYFQRKAEAQRRLDASAPVTCLATGNMVNCF